MAESKLVVAITGGTGFIGRRLVELHARRGDEVRVLSRRELPAGMCAKGVTGHSGDLAGEIPAAFARNVDILYHCAAELNDLSRCWPVNVDGTNRLLQLAHEQGIGRWVQLSSVGVYGPQRTGVVTEDFPMLPGNAYEKSKAEADRRVIEQAGASGFDYSILRPSNVFGPGMPNRSLCQLAEAVRRRLFCFVGPPGATANYIFVDNVADALFLCGTHLQASGRIFNVSDFRTMENFVAAIATTMHVSPPRLRLPVSLLRWLVSMTRRVPGSPLTLARIDALCGRASYSADRIVAELGYQHRVSMEDGLALTLADCFMNRGEVLR